MQRLLAGFLVALMLLQTLGREVMVMDYQLNKARITELYCVNKARPQLHCNGKCYLAQQLRKAEGGDKKAPEMLAKVKYEVLPTATLVLPQPLHWRLPAARFARPAVPHCAAVPGRGVFRPPPVIRLIVTPGFPHGGRPVRLLAPPWFAVGRVACVRAAIQSVVDTPFSFLP